jgi:hypothetical protein
MPRTARQSQCWQSHGERQVSHTILLWRGVRGSLSPIAVARPAIFAHLRRTQVELECAVGWQLSLPLPGHSCSCLTHSFAFVVLVAATSAGSSCALFARYRYPTAQPQLK